MEKLGSLQKPPLKFFLLQTSREWTSYNSLIFSTASGIKLACWQLTIKSSSNTPNQRPTQQAIPSTAYLIFSLRDGFLRKRSSAGVRFLSLQHNSAEKQALHSLSRYKVHISDTSSSKHLLHALNFLTAVGQLFTPLDAPPSKWSLVLGDCS